MPKQKYKAMAIFGYVILGFALSACDSNTGVGASTPVPGLFEIQFDQPLSSIDQEARFEAYRHDVLGEQIEQVPIGSIKLSSTRARIRYVDLDLKSRRTFSTVSRRNEQRFSGELQEIISVSTYLGLPNNRYQFIEPNTEPNCSTVSVSVNVTGLPPAPDDISATSSRQTSFLSNQSQEEATGTIDVCVDEPSQNTATNDQPIIATAIRDVRRSLPDFSINRYGVSTLNAEEQSEVAISLDKAFSERSIELTSDEPLDFALSYIQSFIESQSIVLGTDTTLLGFDSGFPQSIGKSQTAWDDTLFNHQLEVFSDYVQGNNRRRSSTVRLVNLTAPVPDPIQITIPPFPFRDLTFDPVLRRSYGWVLAREVAATVGLIEIQASVPPADGAEGKVLNWSVVFDPALTTSIRLPSIPNLIEILQETEDLYVQMNQYDFQEGQSFDDYWLNSSDQNSSLLEKIGQSNPSALSARSGAFLRSFLGQLSQFSFSEDFLPD